MAYHWKSFITASCFIVTGISRIASPTSRRAAPNPRGSASMRARSSAVSGSSGVVLTVSRIDEIENTAPMRNAQTVIKGMPRSLVASPLIPSTTRMDGVR